MSVSIRSLNDKYLHGDTLSTPEVTRLEEFYDELISDMSELGEETRVAVHTYTQRQAVLRGYLSARKFR